MTDPLRSSQSALLAFQSAMATVSHNVANSTTRGYSRQGVILEALAGTTNQRLSIGAGVAAMRIERMADNLVFARQVNSTGELGRLTQLSNYASRVDKLLTDKDTGMSKPWTAFFAATQDIVKEPASSVTRSALISAGGQLTSRWTSVSSQLNSIDADSNEKLITQVAAANTLAKEVASLNTQIRAAGSSVSNAMLDARAVKLADLAALTGGKLVAQDDGAINLVTENGLAIVSGGSSMELLTTPDPFNPQRSVLSVKTPAGTAGLPAGAIGGELGGILEFRANVIDPARSELDREALAFALEFNKTQRSGVDYNGNLGKDFFSVPTPAVVGSTKNTGTASFSGSISDLSKLSGQDITLSFNAGTWSATRADGQPVAITGTGTAADPFMVEGVALTLGGAPANGDSFQLRPAMGAAEQIKVLITDPNEIAAAAPAQMSLGATNKGSVKSGVVAMTDPTLFAGFTGANVTFIDATHYSVDGGPPVLFNPGDKIVGPGWELSIEGAPAAGDQFNLAPTPARSGDNANARLLAGIDDKPILNGGTTSITNAMGQHTAKIGGQARLADMNLDAQTMLDDQIVAERESLSGVNVEEEAGNMLKFQQAYTAASQVMMAANEMFNAVIAAVRR